MPTTISAATYPWGTVYGEGLFNTNGFEYVLIAADGNVYAALENNFPIQVPLPSGTSITSTVKFTQAGDTVYMWRGTSLEPLRCQDLFVGFTLVADPTGAGTVRIPKGIRALVIANRMWVQGDGSTVWASDELDFETFSLANSFVINSTPGDDLQTITLFGSGLQASIICLKRRSIHRLVNVAGDLAQLLLLTVTTRFGCIAPESAVDIGSDLFWLSDEGVASLSLTEQGEIQPTVRSGREPQPMLSDEIQPLIERINWTYASQAWGSFWNGHYYLAVPLDDAISFREELIDNQVAYRGIVPPHTFTIPDRLVVGATYRYTRADINTTSISDGSTTMTADGDFIAAGTTLSGSSGAATVCTDSLRRVFKGINSAVLVYSTRNAAWAGYDTTPGLEVKSFFTAKVRSRVRMFFVSQDGWINMYEEAFEDAVAVPYGDVSIDSLPQAGDTIQVNGGTLITVAAAASDTATTWACSTLVHAKEEFYILTIGLPSDTFSYNEQNTTPWTAPNTIPSVLTTIAAGDFRFYSTNGLPPEILVTGTWGTVNIVTKQPVPFTVVTRAYKMTDDIAAGRLLRVAAQVATWAPSYTVTALPEGVNESEVLAQDVTRSRTRYFRPFTAADWLQTNVNDDFLTPYREDYSLVFTSQTMGLTLGSNGVKLDQHQEYPHRLHARARGRTMQVKLESTEGRVRLLAAQSEGKAESLGMGIQI